MRKQQVAIVTVAIARIVAKRGLFNRIQQVALTCTPV